MAAFDRHIEAAPGAARLRQPVEHEPVCVRRKPRVGMQEQQHVAARGCRAGIHLRGASARAGDDAIGKRRSKRSCFVRAAAVHDNDFDALRAQRRERFQRGDNVRGFVENRDDDGERRLARHSAASFKAPPQLEPWPAVQPKQWPATRIGLPARSSSSRSRQMQALAAMPRQRQIEHLVEVAVDRHNR